MAAMDSSKSTSRASHTSLAGSEQSDPLQPSQGSQRSHRSRVSEETFQMYPKPPRSPQSPRSSQSQRTPRPHPQHVVDLDEPPAYTPSAEPSAYGGGGAGPSSFIPQDAKKSQRADSDARTDKTRSTNRSMTSTPPSLPASDWTDRVPDRNLRIRSPSPPPAASLTTLERARNQTVQTIAFRATRSFEQVGSLKVGVYARHAAENDEDERSISLDIARATAKSMTLHRFVFALLSTDELGSGEGHFIMCASDQSLVEKAAAFAATKFMGRVAHTELSTATWLAMLGAPSQTWMDSTWSAGSDEEALWHVLNRVAQDDGFGDPFKPPPGSRGIDEILASARSKLAKRLTPREAYSECKLNTTGGPALLVDIRPAAQRQENGMIPGALIVERNVLEWRFDPRSSGKLDIATRYDLRVIVFCQEGYTSSLAAASLVEIGLLNATDISGGYRAWKEAGLPTNAEDAPSESDSLSQQ